MPTHHRKFKIFISYARSNAAEARSAYDRLRSAGFNVWLDVESLQAGSEWEITIEKELRESHVVLVLLSKESVTRDGFLQKEIHVALDVWKNKAPGKIYLIPLRLTECILHERLAKLHCLDVFDEEGWNRLLIQLKQLRSKPGSNSGMCTAPLVSGTAEVKSTNTAASNRRDLPIVVFPDEIERFITGSEYERSWSKLDRNTRRYVRTLGCKLEPIVQIIPAIPIQPVLGFECLALASGGENFGQILKDCKHVDPGTLRICLAIAAVQTIAKLRTNATPSKAAGIRRLKFTLNLDPLMLQNALFKRFLSYYADILERNVIFEVNETTTTKYIAQLKELQVDFNLHFAADDLNQWDSEVRVGLTTRVELTKMDHQSFNAAMAIRGDKPNDAIKKLRAHKFRGKPLVVEGIQNPDHLLFLERKWDYKKHGELYGQGYGLDHGIHWEQEMLSLKNFGLPGGSAIR